MQESVMIHEGGLLSDYKVESDSAAYCDCLSLPFEDNTGGDIRKDVFWRFDKAIVTDEAWKNLRPEGKYVLPVLMRHCNESGTCYPTEKTISIMAGIDLKTAVRGIKAVKENGQVTVNQKRNKDLSMKNTYQLKKAPENRMVRLFPYIFDAGIWAALVPAAKKIFPVLLSGASMNNIEYQAVCDELTHRGREDELEHSTDPDAGRYYSKYSGWQNREWGFFNAKGEDVMWLADIKDRRTFYTGMNDLGQHGLIGMVSIKGEPKLRVQVEKPMQPTLAPSSTVQ